MGKDYPIIEVLYRNKRAFNYFVNKYPNKKFQSDAALIGVTYAGTGELMEAIQKLPSIVMSPKIYTAKEILQTKKLEKIKNCVKRILKRNVVEYDTLEPCAYLLNMYMWAKMYLMGLYYPKDAEERALLSNILRLCPSLASIPYEGKIVSVLADTYGFTGSGFYGIAAFNEPWYYTNKTKFFVMFRDPAEMTYAGFKNEYDRLYWKKKFEDVINFEWIKNIVEEKKYPSFEEMIKKVHPLLYRGFHKKALELWLKHFPHNEFYIIDNKELRDSEDDILNRISQILDISPLIKKKKTNDVGRFSHKFFSFPKISQYTKVILDSFFAYYNDGFKKLLNQCTRVDCLEYIGNGGGGDLAFVEYDKDKLYQVIKKESLSSTFLSNLMSWFEDPSHATLSNSVFLFTLFDDLCRFELYGYALILYGLVDDENKKEHLNNILKKYKIDTNSNNEDYEFLHICGNEKLQNETCKKERYYARLFCYHFLIQKHKNYFGDLVQDWFLK